MKLSAKSVRLAVFLLAVAMLLDKTGAIVCSDGICAVVRCMHVTQDTCDGVIVPKGGFCGCCDACVHEKQLGEKCYLDPLLGAPVPEDHRCVQGSYCDPQQLICVKA